jgi:hypothetical protein
MLSFPERIRQEFIVGSAIAPELFDEAIEFVHDTETLPGGDVRYPIAEALNHKVVRFGRSSRRTEQAALFKNENGSVWQGKLQYPMSDRDTGKLRRYEAPVGNGSRAFMPPVPPAIRKRVAKRYGCFVPMTGSFWAWVKLNKLQIIFTEGGKKALSLLSIGVVAVALYGVNAGYKAKDLAGNRIEPTLITDLEDFATEGRSILLAFDQDVKESTRDRVDRALARFGELLQKHKCSVSIAEWKATDGKGVDDLISKLGPTAWDTVAASTKAFEFWKISNRLNKQLTLTPSLRLSTHDLSNLELSILPKRGIIAISSPKGTGKTKFIGTLTKSEKVILAGHRIALMRNLCQRMHVDYKGDLDKVNGHFIKGSAYSFKIGLCVDSILAINPESFRDCILVVDEITQVLQHLITSSTCQKDGKLPALLARFRQLANVAAQIICADADLNNWSIEYLQALREEDNNVFLIKNEYKSQGYKTRFLNGKNASKITSEILEAIRNRKEGQVIFVATDSRFFTKKLTTLINDSDRNCRVLTINSETSGSETEREFIQSPDEVLKRKDFDVIIASPSLATGVSIESQGIVSHVFGVFFGGACTDADISQALSRVRENVQRTVWCAEKGRSFSKVGKSTNPLELKGLLKQKTDFAVSLLRCQLREDTLGMVDSYDWVTDPHLNLWAQIEANRNFSMLHLRAALKARLQFEGNLVEVVEAETDDLYQYLLKEAGERTLAAEAEAIAAARALTLTEALELEASDAVSREDALALQRFHLAEFYQGEEITPALVLWDNRGRQRGHLLNLEAQLYPGVAAQRDAKNLEKQAKWNQSICPWALSMGELRRVWREKLGLEWFLVPGREWSRDTIEAIATTIRKHSQLVKVLFHLTISDEMSDTQICHQLLAQMGIKLVWRWSRSFEDSVGEKVRVYCLDLDHWERVTGILSARASRRVLGEDIHAGSPLPLDNQNQTGDPSQTQRERENPPLMAVPALVPVVSPALVVDHPPKQLELHLYPWAV